MNVQLCNLCKCRRAKAWRLCERVGYEKVISKTLKATCDPCGGDSEIIERIDQ